MIVALLFLAAGFTLMAQATPPTPGVWSLVGMACLVAGAACAANAFLRWLGEP